MAAQIPTFIDGTVLDQEFELDVALAQDLIRQMRLSEDRRVCVRYLTQCYKMKSENIDVKFHRNRFFRYLLKAMQRAVAAQKDYYINLPQGMEQIEGAEKNEIKQYSEDRRTYIAAKIIPGYATLIYMAVTNNPDDGWDDDGFAKLASYVPDAQGAIDELLKKFQENQAAAQNFDPNQTGGQAAGLATGQVSPPTQAAGGQAQASATP